MKFQLKFYPIETRKPTIVLNEEDARELGVHVSDRLEVSFEGHSTIALTEITTSFVGEGEVGIFNKVKDLLNVNEGGEVEIKPTKRPKSVNFIRRKIQGEILHWHEIREIIQDIVDNHLSDTELSAFVTAGYINGFNMDEIVALTNSMVETGQQMDFGDDVVDKHCIGGVAGNRTTMLIVPIIAAAGLIIPKTSSKAITSPSGTADTMEVLAGVEFGIEEVKDIVNRTNACIVWGGAVNLAPADDKIIQVEYPLSIDPPGQILASVMAKKKSVGSDYVIIDIPVGKGTKMPDSEAANNLAKRFIELGKRLDIGVECLITDGTSPIGSGIGPAPEARDCLLALENKEPVDLINKSLDLAGVLLELSGKVNKGRGREIAEKILVSGRARDKMMEIIEAQGGDPNINPDDIELGEKTCVIESDAKGRIRYIDNKKISHVARAAGAPKDKSAGVYLHVQVGDSVKIGDPLFTLYSPSSRKLEDSIRLTNKLRPIRVGGVILNTLK